MSLQDCSLARKKPLITAKMPQTTSQIIIYEREDGKIKLDVTLSQETVWLSQEQMAALFGKAKSTINEHIKNIYEEE